MEIAFNFDTFIAIFVCLLAIYTILKISKLVIKLGAGAVAIMAIIYIIQNFL